MEYDTTKCFQRTYNAKIINITDSENNRAYFYQQVININKRYLI